jgi:hypothetical protein
LNLVSLTRFIVAAVVQWETDFKNDSLLRVTRNFNFAAVRLYDAIAGRQHPKPRLCLRGKKWLEDARQDFGVDADLGVVYGKVVSGRCSIN